MRVAGGPTEVVLTESAVKITSSGAAGKRTIVLPGSWRVPCGMTKSGATHSFDYSGGETLLTK